jgi:hypothetical protein
MKSALIRLGAIACLLSFGNAAQAQATVSYTNIDLEFVHADIDFGSGFEDFDGDGVNLAGSLNLHKYIHVLGSYERLGLDDTIDNSTAPPTVTTREDLDSYSIGFGFHTPSMGRGEREYRSGLIDRYSLFVQGEYLGTETTDSDTFNGYSFDAGFRSVNHTRMESLLAFGYEKFEKVDGEFTVEGRLFFRIIKDLQLQGGIDWNDNITRWSIGLRYNFPRLTVFR